MKTFLVCGLALLAWFQAAAQVSVQVTLNQKDFLPRESIPVTVKIINMSGQTLHLGAQPNWLTFSVQSADNFVVVQNGNVPVLGKFSLDSSQEAIKHVDLEPYFNITQPGRYSIVATLRIKQWATKQDSPSVHFDVVSGAYLWSQNFGVSTNSNTPPQARKYTLEKANYLQDQLRLYVQVSSADESEVYKVSALGPMVSFSFPDAQVDRQSRLNVLWQTGAQYFTYAIVNPDGTIAKRETYNNYYSTPRLVTNGDGGVKVKGGTLCPAPGRTPMVLAPDQLPNQVDSGSTAGKH